MINSVEMEKLLKEQGLNENFAVVYEKEAYGTQYARFLDVLAAFREMFDKDGKRDVVLLSAPGRSEIGGNHTDHNLGKVLAGSIQLDCIGAVEKTENTITTIKIVSSTDTTLELDFNGEIRKFEKEK